MTIVTGRDTGKKDTQYLNANCPCGSSGRAMLAPTGTHDLQLRYQLTELFVEFSNVITVGEAVV